MCYTPGRRLCHRRRGRVDGEERRDRRRAGGQPLRVVKALELSPLSKGTPYVNRDAHDG